MLRTMARSRGLVPNHEPVFALTHDGRIAQELRTAGCQVHILGRVRARHPFSILHARNKLSTLCRNNGFAATIVHSAWSLALLAPAATRPVVLLQHDTLNPATWSARLSRHAHPDLVIANSEHTAASVAHFYRHADLAIIHPCVEFGNSAIDTPPRNEPRTIILQAARFEPWKGHLLLLNALGNLRDNPDWLLWFAGSAQRPREVALVGQLEAKARDLGITDRVSFLGHVTDMRALMRSVDIYCQPNTEPEAFGLTFIEALDAKVPIVTTALGGAKEILQPDWGLLTAPTVDSVANALHHLLTSPRLRAKFANAGQDRARQLCHPQPQIQKLENAIQSLRINRRAA